MPSPLLRLLATAAAAVVLIPATAHAADVAAVGAQQKLTRIGPDGNLAFSAHDPAIAYNSVDDEFLLAWLGRDPAAPGETEVYGQILDGTGKPEGHRPPAVDRWPATRPTQPVVSYSSAVNTYMLAYVAPPPAGPNNPAGQEEIIGQIVTATGAPSGEPARISDTDPFNADADQASDPAVAYDPAHDQFRFVWRADATVEGDFEVQTRRVSSTLIDADGIPSFQVSTTAAGDANEPDIVYLPAQERYVIAWEGDIAAGDSEIFVEVEKFDSAIITNDTQVSVAAGIGGGGAAVAGREHARQRGARRVHQERHRRRGPGGLHAAALVVRRPAAREHAGRPDLDDGPGGQPGVRRQPRPHHDRDVPPAARPVLRDLGGGQRPARDGRQRVRALRPGARRRRPRGRRRRHPALDPRRRRRDQHRARGRRDRRERDRAALAARLGGRRQPPADWPTTSSSSSAAWPATTATSTARPRPPTATTPTRRSGPARPT